MPRHSKEQKISLEPILQDYSVSSFSDTNQDEVQIDETLTQRIADYDVSLSDDTQNKTEDVNSGSYPPDSTITDILQIKSPIFKKPFNRRSKKMPRTSLFDSDLGDSEPESPKPKGRPFQKKQKPPINASMFDILSSNNSLNNSESVPNFITRRRIRLKKNIENSLFDKDLNSTLESDVSIPLRPLLKRRKTNHKKLNLTEFDHVFDQTQNDSQHDKSVAQKKIPFKSLRSRHTNVNSDLFDSDLNSSNSFQLSSSHISLKKGKNIKNMKYEPKNIEPGLFDSDLESSNSLSQSVRQDSLRKNSTLLENKLSVDKSGVLISENSVESDKSNQNMVGQDINTSSDENNEEVLFNDVSQEANKTLLSETFESNFKNSIQLENEQIEHKNSTGNNEMLSGKSSLLNESEMGDITLHEKDINSFNNVSFREISKISGELQNMSKVLSGSSTDGNNKSLEIENEFLKNTNENGLHSKNNSVLIEDEMILLVLKEDIKCLSNEKSKMSEENGVLKNMNEIDKRSKTEENSTSLEIENTEEMKGISCTHNIRQTENNSCIKSDKLEKSIDVKNIVDNVMNVNNVINEAVFSLQEKVHTSLNSNKEKENTIPDHFVNKENNLTGTYQVVENENVSTSSSFNIVCVNSKTLDAESGKVDNSSNNASLVEKCYLKENDSGKEGNGKSPNIQNNKEKNDILINKSNFGDQTKVNLLKGKRSMEHEVYTNHCKPENENIKVFSNRTELENDLDLETNIFSTMNTSSRGSVSTNCQVEGKAMNRRSKPNSINILERDRISSSRKSIFTERSFSLINVSTFDNKNVVGSTPIIKDKRVSFNLENNKRLSNRKSIINNIQEQPTSKVNEPQTNKSVFSLDSLVIDPSENLTSDSVFIDLHPSKIKSTSASNTESNISRSVNAPSSSKDTTISRLTSSDRTSNLEDNEHDIETDDDIESTSKENNVSEDENQMEDFEEESSDDEERVEEATSIKESEVEEESVKENTAVDEEESIEEDEEESIEEDELVDHLDETVNESKGDNSMDCQKSRDDEEGAEEETSIRESEVEEESVKENTVVDEEESIEEDELVDHLEGTMNQSVGGNSLDCQNRLDINFKHNNETPQYNSHIQVNKLPEKDQIMFSHSNSHYKNPHTLTMNASKRKSSKTSVVFKEPQLVPLNRRKTKEILDTIPLSDLKKRRKKSCVPDITMEQIQQNNIEKELTKRQKQGITSTKKKSYKLKRPKKWVTPKLYKFIIDKLQPRFGLNSRIRAENLVLFLVESVESVLKKETNYFQVVEEIKHELASLGIIHTHFDFYEFTKFFDGSFRDKVYPFNDELQNPFLPGDVYESIL